MQNVLVRCYGLQKRGRRIRRLYQAKNWSPINARMSTEVKSARVKSGPPEPLVLNSGMFGSVSDRVTRIDGYIAMSRAYSACGR